LMPREFCPRCGAVGNMEVTVSRRQAKAPDGTVKEIVTKTFHCEACHSFVRSEDTETTGIQDC